jgi:AcrR family transcriptional regulator
MSVSPDRREQRRLEHQDLSRAQLLDAAEEIFGRKGFHDTTLKEVADRAGFSVGSVYSFFDNKDHLFGQVYLRRADEFMPGLRDVVGAPGSALDVLYEVVTFQVQFFRDHPHFGRLYLFHSGHVFSTDAMPPFDPAIVANFEEAMDLQSALFDRGQRAGELRAGDPGVLSRLFSGLVAAYQETMILTPASGWPWPICAISSAERSERDREHHQAVLGPLRRRHRHLPLRGVAAAA